MKALKPAIECSLGEDLLHRRRNRRAGHWDRRPAGVYLVGDRDMVLSVCRGLASPGKNSTTTLVWVFEVSPK
jgi:hypothetical protein